MSSLPVPISSSLVRSVAMSILPGIDQAHIDSKICLTVRIRSTNIVARDFAAFLELLDHLYGRSCKDDFRSYARSERGHFTFSKCRQGSWELIAERALGLASGSSPFVIIWLALKYLPSATPALSSAYNQYEQGRLTRINRQRIREEVKRDVELSRLTPTQRAEVARIIENISKQEASLMPRVRRFMADSFLDVKALVTKKHEDET